MRTSSSSRSCSRRSCSSEQPPLSPSCNALAQVCSCGACNTHVNLDPIGHVRYRALALVTMLESSASSCMRHPVASIMSSHGIPPARPATRRQTIVPWTCARRLRYETLEQPLAAISQGHPPAIAANGFNDALFSGCGGISSARALASDRSIVRGRVEAGGGCTIILIWSFQTRKSIQSASEPDFIGFCTLFNPHTNSHTKAGCQSSLCPAMLSPRYILRPSEPSAEWHRVFSRVSRAIPRHSSR